MPASNIGYSIREAFRHFRRSWSTVLGAVVTIFLSLFIIGLFVFGSVVVENIFGSVIDQVTIQAFLSDNAKKEDVDALQAQIKTWPNVQSITYKSKDDALKEYKDREGDKKAQEIVFALDGSNPLPASIIIKLEDSQQVKATADKLLADPEFAKVVDNPEVPAQSVLYGQGDVEKLFSITNSIRNGGIVLVALLTFIAFVFINNTIRLAITARRREIAIERLVGASNSFIRGPFLAEGALESLIGALIAVGALQAVNVYGLPAIQKSLPFLPFSISSTVMFQTYAALIGVGILIGLFGSAIAMRRYLKV